MDGNENLFELFPPVAKADWVDQVRRELRGKPWAELQWPLTESLRLDPFFHPDDGIAATGPLPKIGMRRNDWEIGEYIPLADSLPEANEAALQALEGGAGALLFECGERPFDGAGLETLLKGIETSMITLHFEFSLAEACDRSRNVLVKIPAWRGSYYVAANGGGLPEQPEEAGTNVRTLVIDGRAYYRGLADTPAELAAFLRRARAVFDEQPPEQVNRRTKLLLVVDKSYFVSIAKIRTLKILWANFIRAYGLDPLALPEIEVHFAPYAPNSDPNTNMIRAATQALSAAIGGADRLFVRPAAAESAGGLSSADTRRIARNVQHLLKMESYIDRVVDPAAGAYYIEKLTGALAEEAWRKFSDRR